MKKVIYVHGIGQQASSTDLKREWDIALFGKPMDGNDNKNPPTSMAYWANLMHDEAEIAALRSKSARSILQQRDPGKRLVTTLDFDFEKIVSDAGIPRSKQQQAQDLLAALVNRVGEPTGSTALGTRSSSSRALPLPQSMRIPIAKQLLSWLLPEVAKYFFHDKIRKEVQNKLRDLIKQCDRPFVIVSHSLGTVISYDILSEDFKRPPCDLFLTLGSPLGIQEVQDVIVAEGRKLMVPEGVRAWKNYCDRLDPVALDAGLTNDFQPTIFTGEKLSKKVAIEDKLIINERTFEIRKFNPHSSIGYLSHQEIRQLISAEVRLDLGGRFLVARDVVEETVDPSYRVPLLIEVLEPGYAAVDETDKKRQDRENRQRRAKSKSDESKDETSRHDLTTLAGRIAQLRDEVEAIAITNTLGPHPKKKEREELIESIGAIGLRKYVAANLTRDEVRALTEKYCELSVYAIWKNSTKSKLLKRSHIPLKADAGRVSYQATGKDILWAVLDTGVNWKHPHFDDHETILEVWDCTTNSPTPELIGPNGKNHTGTDCDVDGHGTHVCGIIAGAGQVPGSAPGSNQSISGVAPQAKLIVYKVLDDSGGGTDAWVIKALDHIHQKNTAVVRSPKVHGVNLSLGGPFDATIYGCGYSPICKELRDLWRQGTLVCVAAGNEGQIEVSTGSGTFNLNTQLSIGDPANLDDCIAVGSINADKPYLYGVSWFSSRGPTADGRLKPDVVAPGERIESCAANYELTEVRYREDSGTSMACPHVSGLLAAFLSVRREFIGRPDDVKKILLENCNDLGRDRYHQGAGLPNLMAMLTNT
jgi:subtilisin family serine protease